MKNRKEKGMPMGHFRSRGTPETGSGYAIIYDRNEIPGTTSFQNRIPANNHTPFSKTGRDYRITPQDEVNIYIELQCNRYWNIE
jgi:hypothetical protein